MRDGREQEISSFGLVVGDVLVVEGGDILPADGILVDGSTLRYLSPSRPISISLSVQCRREPFDRGIG